MILTLASFMEIFQFLENCYSTARLLTYASALITKVSDDTSCGIDLCDHDTGIYFCVC